MSLFYSYIMYNMNMVDKFCSHLDFLYQEIINNQELTWKIILIERTFINIKNSYDWFGEKRAVQLLYSRHNYCMVEAYVLSCGPILVLLSRNHQEKIMDKQNTYKWSFLFLICSIYDLICEKLDLKLNCVLYHCCVVGT